MRNQNKRMIIAAVLVSLAGAVVLMRNRWDLWWVWTLSYLLATVSLSIVVGVSLQPDRTYLRRASRIVGYLGIIGSLLVIFSIAPMEIIPDFRKFEHNAPSLDGKAFEAQLVIEEHKKAVEEIKNRDLEDDSWFHNKFLLVGGLLAATLGYMKFGSGKSPDERLGHLLRSPSAAAILALACVVTLGIDLHIRESQCVTDQLGLWIRSYVEPLMHGGTGNGCNDCKWDVNNTWDGSKKMTGFIGWEEFLRLTKSDTKPSKPKPSETKTEEQIASEGGLGLHSSVFANLLDTPDVHFLTILLYLLYVFAFQAFALNPTARGRAEVEHRNKYPPHSLALYCFAIVHIGLLVFVWAVHSAPEVFQIQALPFSGKWESGAMVPAYYLAPCIALVILNWPYITKYRATWTANS
jgi:hypothetical protein